VPSDVFLLLRSRRSVRPWGASTSSTTSPRSCCRCSCSPWGDVRAVVRDGWRHRWPGARGGRRWPKHPQPRV